MKFEDLKVWKQKALYLSLNCKMSGAMIARQLGKPERTVQDNIKKLKDRFTVADVFDPETGKRETFVMNTTQAKILFHDIECSHGLNASFGQWNQNLTVDQLLAPSVMLSHSWAWGDGKIYGTVLTPEEALNRDDSRIVLEAWKLLNECDIYVAHNGKNFDVRKLNGYFLSHGLPPPSPYKVVDTLKIAKKYFNLPFLSLKYLCRVLGVVQKIDNSGHPLWIGCMSGNAEDLKTMLEYNIGDIDCLREVYKRLITWGNDAVNMALYRDVEGLLCPHCGSEDVEKLVGRYVYTAQRRYQAYRCRACKAPVRGGSLDGNEDKKLYRII